MRVEPKPRWSAPNANWRAAWNAGKPEPASSTRNCMSENLHKRLSQALGPQDNCPSLDRLIELLDGPNKTEAEAHVASCAHCASEIALFREFQEPIIRPNEK